MVRWIVRIYIKDVLSMTRTFDKKKVAVAECNHWNSIPSLQYRAELERKVY